MVTTPVPPHPRDEDAERPPALDEGRTVGLGQRGEPGRDLDPRPAPPRGRPLDAHEARAEALDAREVLVAGGLVDLALAPVLGVEGQHREAVRLRVAVPAALADPVVDERAPVRVHHRAALAAPALLGRAGLVVDEDAHPLDLAELTLDLVEVAPVGELRPASEHRGRAVLLRLVGHEPDRLHPLAPHLVADRGGVDGPVVGLPAGHRHRVVEEDLVGDVGPGRDARPDREEPGVVVGAVAEVLEDVPGLDEGGLPHPVRALPSHVGVGDVAAVHVGGHEVAPDPALGAAPLRHPGRGVVGAARAEVRGARHREGLAGAGLARLRVEERDPVVDGRRGVKRGDARREGPRDVVRGDLREAGEEHPSRLVLLPDDPGAAPVGERIEGVANLELGEGHLLLDDEDLLESVRELAHRLRVERVGHRELQNRDPEIVRRPVVDPEVEEGLADVVPRLAGRDDPVPRAAGSRG